MKFAVEAKRIYLWIVNLMVSKYSNSREHDRYYKHLFISEINQYIKRQK